MAESNPKAAALDAIASSSAPAVVEKAICPICYDDLHTVSELLQSIPVCGHVFHEFCLRHWTDYCLAGKEPTCPVCKQCYAELAPTRLYFQSTANSDSTDTEEAATNPSSMSANLPQGAVMRMELRISAIDARVRDVDYKVNRLFSESSSREVNLLSELTRQKQLYAGKTAELAKKTADCNDLKKKNSSLSKKLSDINSETRKLNSRCSILTRSEARTQRKLDEALKLNEQLKERIEEFQREKKGTTGKALGKRKAEALDSKVFASLKNEKAARKCKAEAVVSDTKQTVAATKFVVAKKPLVLSEPDFCPDADDKISEKSYAAGTHKSARAVRMWKTLDQSQKAEVVAASPKIENRVKGRRSKIGKKTEAEI